MDEENEVKKTNLIEKNYEEFSIENLFDEIKKGKKRIKIFRRFILKRRNLAIIRQINYLKNKGFLNSIK